MGSDEDECCECGYFELKLPIIEEIKKERKRQNELWGEQNHKPLMWLAILGEEVGEANKEALEEIGLETQGTALAYKKYRTELIHVAAVALQAVECLDRHNGEVKA